MITIIVINQAKNFRKDKFIIFGKGADDIVEDLYDRYGKDYLGVFTAEIGSEYDLPYEYGIEVARRVLNSAYCSGMTDDDFNGKVVYDEKFISMLKVDNARLVEAYIKADSKHKHNYVDGCFRPYTYVDQSSITQVLYTCSLLCRKNVAEILPWCFEDGNLRMSPPAMWKDYFPSYPSPSKMP